MAPGPEPAPVAEERANTPRSRKGALTRARLLEAAKSVFEDTGFLEARISDIAERAALSHGSFYHYFDSKEEIFREVAETYEALLTLPQASEWEKAGTEGKPEFDRIVEANRLYLERYRENAKIMGVIEEVSRYDAHVNRARATRQRRFAERAERRIRQLQRRGLADASIDPAIAAVALGSMVARFAELWLVQGWEDYEFEAAVDQLSRLWAQSIGVEAPPRERRR